MKYNRILLKLSGESLQGTQKYGLSTDVLHSYAEQIKAVVGTGVQVGIVIGGGNIFRGLQGARKGFDRVKGDQMGMLATIINSLALQSALACRRSCRDAAGHADITKRNYAAGGARREKRRTSTAHLQSVASGCSTASTSA